MHNSKIQGFLKNIGLKHEQPSYRWISQKVIFRSEGHKSRSSTVTTHTR